jgi:predicted DNA-binding transcriptional regulator AlpA
MRGTSDISEYRNRPTKYEKSSQPGQSNRPGLIDQQLLDELAQRLADKLAPLLIDRLAPLLVDRIADRLEVTSEQLYARLGDPHIEQPEALVDASEIARRTGRSRWWVYEHAGELGAVRLGSGSRPRLAFWSSRVDEYLQAATQLNRPIPAPARAWPQRRQRTRRTLTGVELLPIRGRNA